jgi:hypothetical protein
MLLYRPTRHNIEHNILEGEVVNLSPEWLRSWRYNFNQHPRTFCWIFTLRCCLRITLQQASRHTYDILYSSIRIVTGCGLPVLAKTLIPGYPWLSLVIEGTKSAIRPESSPGFRNEVFVSEDHRFLNFPPSNTISFQRWGTIINTPPIINDNFTIALSFNGVTNALIKDYIYNKWMLTL